MIRNCQAGVVAAGRAVEVAFGGEGLGGGGAVERAVGGTAAGEIGAGAVEAEESGIGEQVVFEAAEVVG